MLISIITPTFNRADLLVRTIKSVQQQTYENWELIIVDDGSTDETEKKIEAFLEDKRIRFLKKENSGATHSRNVGVTHANGDFITFLDSDDEAYPNWLEVVSLLIDDNTGIICVGAIRKMLDGQMIKELPYDFKYFNENVKIKFTSGSLIINKAIFNEAGGYDIQLKSNQHTDLGYRLLQNMYGSSIKKKIF